MRYGPLSYFDPGRVLPRGRLREAFGRLRRRLGGALLPSAAPPRPAAAALAWSRSAPAALAWSRSAPAALAWSRSAPAALAWSI